ncbi:hypothetical protein [Streptomyces sp. NPDC026673]|uniref:hypothetical protein n=1 Tax=Streptomyces sp. NPDC026673 TaxID=3155724 RepID=UPI0033F8AD27
MKIVLGSLACLALLWTVGSGVVALTTGRVLAFRAERIVRPALWGTAQLCAAAGAVMAGLMTRFTVMVGDVLGAAVLVCLLAHSVLHHRAQRP